MGQTYRLDSFPAVGGLDEAGQKSACLDHEIAKFTSRFYQAAVIIGNHVQEGTDLAA